jgi:hypothetical protein
MNLTILRTGKTRINLFIYSRNNQSLQRQYHQIHHSRYSEVPFPFKITVFWDKTLYSPADRNPEDGGSRLIGNLYTYLPNYMVPNPTRQLSLYHREKYLTIFHFISFHTSRDSAVGIATGYGLDSRRLGVRVPAGPRFFFLPRSPGRFWGPPSPLSNRYRGLFLRV